VDQGDSSDSSLSRTAAALGLPRDADVTAVLDAIAALRVRAEAADPSDDALFLRSIVEHIPAMIFVKDARDLRFARFNRAGEALLGTPRGELIGRSDHDLFPKAEADAFVTKDREVLSHGGVHEIIEEPIHTPSGERWLNTWKIPIRDEQGEPLYLLGISLDVTSARAHRLALESAESELRVQAQKLQVALRSFPGAVWTTDADLRVLSADGALAAALGLGADAIGTDLRERRVANPSAEESAPALEDALGGLATRYDLHTTEGPFEVQVYPMDPVGSGVLGVALDITARRAMEAQRLQTRLERAQQLETLGLLAGGIAHDFNNLLAVIMGNANLASVKLQGPSVVRDAVKRIETAAATGAELTRQMLAYSGRGTFVVEPIDLTTVIKEIAELLRVTVGKGVHLKVALAESLPACRVDVAQVRQLIMNLLTNASDAIGGRDGTITVATGVVFADRPYLAATYLDEDLPEGQYVWLEVSDTGCGMDAETQRRMFDPFFTTKQTGHGLGLSATLGIVRGHRGALRVYSEPQRGTTIKVLLPAVPSGQPTTDAPPEPESVARAGACILVVDDEPQIRATLRDALAHYGLSVLEAVDGEDALRVYHEHGHHIDLVLLDMSMPRLDGEATFGELRRMDAAVRVLLTSGYTERDATTRFAGKGLAGFVQKPFRLPELIAHIDRLLGGDGAARTPTSERS